MDNNTTEIKTEIKHTTNNTLQRNVETCYSILKSGDIFQSNAADLRIDVINSIMNQNSPKKAVYNDGVWGVNERNGFAHNTENNRYFLDRTGMFLRTHQSDWASLLPSMPVFQIKTNDKKDEKLTKAYTKYLNKFIENNSWVMDDYRFKNEGYKSGMVIAHIYTEDGIPKIKEIPRKNLIFDKNVFGKEINHAKFVGVKDFVVSRSYLSTLKHYKKTKYYINDEIISDMIAKMEVTGTGNDNEHSNQQNIESESVDMYYFRLKGKIYKALCVRETYNMFYFGVEEAIGKGIGGYPFSVWYVDNTFSYNVNSPATQALPLITDKVKYLHEAEINMSKKNSPDIAFDSGSISDYTPLWNKDPRKRMLLGINDKTGVGINNLFKHIEVGPISENLEMFSYQNRILQEESGIDPDSNGQSSQTRVGIYAGNEANATRRKKPLIDSYYLFWRKIIIMTLGYVSDNYSNLEKEPEFANVSKTDDINEYKNFDINQCYIEFPEKSNDYNIFMQQKKDQFLQTVIQTGIAKNNEEVLKKMGMDAGFDNNTLRTFFENLGDSSENSISESLRDIEYMVETGKKSRKNENADITYLTTMVNYLKDNKEDSRITQAISNTITEYITEIQPIVSANMKEKLQIEAMSQPIPEQPVQQAQRPPI